MSEIILNNEVNNFIYYSIAFFATQTKYISQNNLFNFFLIIYITIVFLCKADFEQIFYITQNFSYFSSKVELHSKNE